MKRRTVITSTPERLEQDCLVSADVGAGKRRGQTLTWHTDQEKLAEVGKLCISYASGD